MAYSLVVFDWDGTLLDSAGAIASAIQFACRDLGFPIPADERARHVIGLGLNEGFRYTVPNIAEDQLPTLIERYRFHYLSGDQKLKLFPGVTDLLANLSSSGYQLAVATGKSRIGLNRALAHSGLSTSFAATRCADECFSKPHPQMLLELMELLSVVPEKTLMIGDTTHDLQLASNAGVASLAVTYGAHSVSRLEEFNALAMVDDVATLSAWLAANG